MKRLLICWVLLLSVATAQAQTPSPEAMVRQILQAHIGPNGLPSDFVIQGQVTDSLGTRSFRMVVKGKNQIRYEQTQGAKTNVSLYNAGIAWAGSSAAL